MRRFTVACVWLAFSGAAAPAAAQQTLVPATAGDAAILTSHGEIRGAIERITAASASWRDALDRITRLGRTVLVLTPDQVRFRDAPGAAGTDAFDATMLAEVSPVVGPDSVVEAVLVVVNVDLLTRVHDRIRSLPEDFLDDLDRILIHEVYGHAVPYLLAGHVSGRCPDPLPRQDARAACSIVRENQVRAEMGLGLRTDYALGGLALGRRIGPPH